MTIWPTWEVVHECADKLVAFAGIRVLGKIKPGGGATAWSLGQPGDLLVHGVVYCPKCGEKLPVKLNITVEEAPT